MQNSNKNIHTEISGFINKYCKMNIKDTVTHCPYWMNRLRDGKVVLRGFANGKGGMGEIRDELIKRLNGLPQEDRFKLTPENLRKFARRERIGIDCSGLVYRVLDELLHLSFSNLGYKGLDQIFSGGISKTNVKTLTSSKYSKEMKNIRDFRLGDMIRLRGGKHALVIISNDQKEIIYAHSSASSTKIQGVHTSVIRIIDKNKPLIDQEWTETTRKEENFGKKYFHPEKGDGVFRLKIFR